MQATVAEKDLGFIELALLLWSQMPEIHQQKL
jgi:hypothetical protein